jgi:hypothetical protein
MSYEAFRTIWDYALQESRFPTLGLQPTETLNTRTLNREYRIYVEPLGGQDAKPFHVTATLWWHWDALHTARTNTADEDVLHQMVREPALENVETEKPCVRVDIVLEASAPFRKPIPMPGRAAWAQWVREARGRLNDIEPLIPEESVRENDEGRLEVLGWQDELKAKVMCDDGGELLLESVEVAAFQIIELSRDSDSFDRASDDDSPEEQLRGLFHRVRAALSAWMQAVDHLRPRGVV